MHTGYDNYWMCNRQETVPNLPSNGSLSDCISLNSYTHILDGRQTCHLNNFVSTQKNLNQNMTPQDMLNYPQKTSQYDWTSVAPQSSIPYNYQPTGVHLQQKDSTVHWQNFGPRHLDRRNSVAPPLNYNDNICQKTQFLEDQYNQPTKQTPRIRVRDVNSLNKIAQNSSPTNGISERQFDKYFNRGYNINQRQQDSAQKHSVDHAKNIPSLFEVNSFRPLMQKPSAALEPGSGPVRREWFPNMYPKPRGRVLPSSQYQVNNMRRKERPYGTSHSLLQDLLGGVNQVSVLRPEARQNVHAMNYRLNVPSSTTENSDLSLPRLLEDNYNLCQASYQNPPPYSESLQRTNLSPLRQGNNLPITEPISPPISENNVSGESSIRVTAVISLPEWCGGRVLNKISVPSNENPDCMTVIESAKESENPEVPNSDLPSAVPNNDPSDCLKVKEEPTFGSEFSQDNTTEILVEAVKTEDFGEQDENASQNSEQQISDKSTPTAASATTAGDNNNNNNSRSSDDNNSSSNNSNNNNNNNNNNNKDDNLNLDKSKTNQNVQTSTEKLTDRVKTTDNPSENSSHTSEIKLEVKESNYKSKINRDKLDLLIEFLNASDKHVDYGSGQNFPEKSKKQRKKEGFSSVKSNKSTSEKSKNSISGKVARVEVARRSSHLPTTKSDDSAKKAQIETKKEQSPVLKTQSKEVGEANKGKLKNYTKKVNSTDNGLRHSKEQDNRPKNKDSKTARLEKKQKTINKSVSAEDQTQVTVTAKSEYAEKSKNLESSKPETDADVTRSEKCSEVGSRLQGSQETKGNLQTHDVNQNEKPKIKPTAEVVKTEFKGCLGLVPSVKEEESQKRRDEAQKDIEKKDKSTRIIPNLKYQFCESCVTVSPTECFWINVISGEVKCSNCFRKGNLDSIKSNHKLFSDDKNVETKADKEGCATKSNSLDQKNARTKNSENQTNQKEVNVIPSENSDDKKCQRRQSTGKEEPRREKRRSVDENSFRERKEKRRKSEEKCGNKAQEEISETSTNKSKMHGVSEGSKTDKSIRKSLSNDRSQSPKKERPKKNTTDQVIKSVKDEGPFSKVMRKAESNCEAEKKLGMSPENLCPRKLQVIEEVNENCADKYSRKSVEVLKAVKQVETEKTEDFRSSGDGEKMHADYKKTSSPKTLFSWSKDLLKENQCTKVRNPGFKKLEDRRRRHDERRKSEKEIARSSEEQGERKKRTIKGPLHYKDFVLKKSPVFYFPDKAKAVPFTKILEEVDVAKRNGKFNEER